MSWRVLVTGSEGFVGKHLCTALEEAGHTVIGASRSCETSDRRRKTDIGDPEDVHALIEWAGDITHVAHLAGITSVPDADAAPGRVIRTNVEGTANLLGALLHAGTTPRMLFAGSCQAYGEPEALPITEDHPFRAQGMYAVSKAAADGVCEHFARVHGLPIVRVRAFNHSGPGQQSGYSLSRFAKEIATIEAGNGEPVIRVGNLAAKRDLLHVSDVVAAYIGLLDERVPVDAYNVCAGRSHSIGDLLDRMLEHANVAIETESDPSLFRPVDVAEIRGSRLKLSSTIDWQPQKTIDDLLSDLLTDWRARVAAD